MSVLLHAALKGEVGRLETLLASATNLDDVALIRCALADLITAQAGIRKRLDDEWGIDHPRWAKAARSS